VRGNIRAQTFVISVFFCVCELHNNPRVFCCYYSRVLCVCACVCMCVCVFVVCSNQKRQGIQTIPNQVSTVEGTAEKSFQNSKEATTTKASVRTYTHCYSLITLSLSLSLKRYLMKSPVIKLLFRSFLALHTHTHTHTLSLSLSSHTHTQHTYTHTHIQYNNSGYLIRSAISSISPSKLHVQDDGLETTDIAKFPRKLTKNTGKLISVNDKYFCYSVVS